MMFRIVHRTNYRYNAPVSRARNEAHLRPRDTDVQQCLTSELVVEPTPTSWTERTDFFGNPVVSFAVDGPFEQLTITSTSSVSVAANEGMTTSGPAWELARDSLTEDLSPDMLAAR
jgi:transglutaminase-like putative cysteine protease